MPNRYLRESYIESEAVNKLSWPAEVLWTRLLTKVDDFGRCEANPKLLRAKIFPLRLDTVRESDMPRWLAECDKAGCIRLYQVDGKDYLVVNKWERGRAERSRYPEPPPICEQVQTVASGCTQSQTIPPTPIPIPTTTPITTPTPQPPGSPPSASRDGVREGKDSSRVPTTDQSRRIARVFHRNLTTRWSKKEVEAYQQIGTVPEEDLAALERYYAANWPPKRNVNILRHNLITFLNNFPGEVDRAKAMKEKPKSNKAGEWSDSRPKPPPTPSDPAEVERIRAEAKRQAEQFRKGAA